MNKQEAIKKIDRTLSLPRPIGGYPYDYEDGLRYAKRIISQINEPEKPVIPQLVAEWIEVCKEHLTTSLYTAMNPNFIKENNQSFNFILWIKKTSNQDLFARAWLDGYEVEQKKRYRIKMKNEEYNHTVVIGDYTREEIEATGFGWVFDCEDAEVEVQEVE